MLEPRKLKVVCFKARLKKNARSLTFSIDIQLLTSASASSLFKQGRSNVKMYQHPELRDNSMYLRGSDPDTPSTVREPYVNVDTAFEQQKLNLKEAGHLIKYYMEQGYYGEGKRCRQA